MAKSAGNGTESEGSTAEGHPPRSAPDQLPDSSNENSTSGTARSEPAAGPHFAIERIFIRDLSFESPRAPDVFSLQGRPPEIKLDVQTRARLTEPVSGQMQGADRFEVVLTLTLKATTDNEGELMIVEVQQAGLFHIRGMDAPTRQRVLAVVCPATLFPYAREAIDSIAVKGGFPPPALNPVNFEALYARALEEERAGNDEARPPSPATQDN
ncbi:protein-export chaperone SecB [Thioalkalivibrio sp. HK1]|uniref:protein-export chaperone SecB n=1 Tax=Thioalkalivibrio sp. HK1 TaxID=1469245 RepID=UPI00046FDA02|nr:protein-export chaperone SecB [Thioalkalivibrio sp. HK1]